MDELAILAPALDLEFSEETGSLVLWALRNIQMQADCLQLLLEPFELYLGLIEKPAQSTELPLCNERSRSKPKELL